MEINIAIRLKEEREGKNITQKQVADLTEVTIKTARRWENDGVLPSDKLLMLESLGLDVVYILTGRRANQSQQVMSDPLDEFSYVPLYDVQVSAGHGAFLQSAEQVVSKLAFRTDWLANKNLKAEHLFCVCAEGDSMYPTINNKDTLLANSGQTEPKDGNIYIIRNGDTLWVKRVQVQPGGNLLLISDNKTYPDMQINLAKHDDVEIIGRVESISKDFF